VNSDDIHPLNAIGGTAIAWGLGYLFFLLLQRIAQNLPTIDLDASAFARSMAIGIRYLLVGSIGLLTFTFVMAGVGLCAYSGQLLWQGWQRRS
ncbi:MAG: DUF3082 domain-containing protein, partial [Cyanobacteria bacterium J06639_1]